MPNFIGLVIDEKRHGYVSLSHTMAFPLLECHSICFCLFIVFTIKYVKYECSWPFSTIRGMKACLFGQMAQEQLLLYYRQCYHKCSQIEIRQSTTRTTAAEKSLKTLC